MSKKKDGKDDFFKIIRELNDTFSSMNEEEREMFEDLVKGNVNPEKMIDENWHTYELPDYSAMIHPLAEWLQPLATFSHLSEFKELCLKAAMEAEKLERAQLVADLHNFIYTYLAFMHGDNEIFQVKLNNKHLFAAFWLISHFNLTEMLDDVFETLRQKYAVLNYVYLTGTQFVGTAILHEIGKNQMEKLVEFLNSQGYIPLSKPIVFDALAYTYMLDPDLRLKALHHINNYLQRCLDIGLQGGHVANISHYAHTLACVHAKETLPMLRRIYKSLDIPAIEVRDIREVEKIMADKSQTLHDVMPKTMDDFAEYVVQIAIEKGLDEFGDRNDLDDEDEEDWDDFDDEDWEEFDEDEEDEDNEEDEDFDEDDEDDFGSYFDEDIEQKKYILKVTLDGSRKKVERLLQVPSNLFLDNLTHILFISFGWSDYSSLSWFESARKKYFNPTFFDEGAYDDVLEKKHEGFSSDYYVCSDLVTRRSPKADFCIQLGSTVWRCKIRLQETGMYVEDDEQPYVVLLKATGAFPVPTMVTMDDYERSYEAGRLKEPDLEELNDDLSDFENDML